MPAVKDPHLPLSAPPPADPDLRQCLCLSLHGDAHVHRGQAPPLPLRGRAAGLVALAALEPGLRRENAAAMLWPAAAQPRQALRQQLLRFRQQLGGPLVEGADTLHLAAGVQLKAAALGAELLAGEPVLDDDFGRWLAAQRRALRQPQQQRLAAALAEAEARGDMDAALHHAQALLALDDQDESHHAGLMRVHFLRGEGAAGLAVYKSLCHDLAARLGTGPAAGTQALEAALRKLGQARWPAPNPACSLPVTLKRPPVMAGRADERDAVMAAWRNGLAVLVEGEAGMGKSRLLSECVASLPGPLLQAASRPGDHGVPYSSLARLLRPLLGAGALQLSPWTQQALARLGIQGSGPATEPGAAASATTTGTLPSGAMPAAVSELLERAAVATVVLDDLHFADAATLELLSGLVAAGAPGCWLFAQRPAEAPTSASALRQALTELQRLAVVVLTPLDSPATAELLDALALPGLDGPALAGPLVRHSGGNPLYMLETLKQGLQDGSLALGRLPRPASVGALIEQRLQRLSPPALTLARVAAIAGVDFGIELAESATGQPAVQLASAWQELQDAQVLRDEALAHDLVADAVLRGVPPVVARRVHEQCAQWLAARGVEPARVARHWHRGGAPAEAGRAYCAAAERAVLAARLHEEAALYEQAAQAFAEAGLPDERFNALLGRVRSLSQCRFDDLALQECQALADAACTDAQRIRAHSERCGLLTERGESLAALEAGQAALALANRLNDHEWQVRTACHMAASLNRLGRSEEAVSLLAPLRAGVTAQPDDALRMLWHGDWGAALGNTGRLSEAVAAFEVALSAARGQGMQDAEGRLLLNCSVALRQSGQLDRALLLSRQGQALSAAKMSMASELPIDALVMARDEAETGHYSAALAVLEPVLAAFELRGTAFWVQACRMVLARLWLDLGQYARAVPLLREETADLPPWLRADRRLLQLDLARALHQSPPANALDEAWALAALDPQRGPSLCVRVLRAWPPDEVQARADDIAKTLRSKERHGALLALHVHTARAACSQGRTDTAAAAARAAAALLGAGYSPESMYRPEAHLVIWQTLTQAQAHTEAEAARRAGTAWIQSCALPEVPAPFLDSFLNRNRVNRELLAAAPAA